MTEPAGELRTYREALRMAHPPDPEALEAERRQLRELESKGAGARFSGYLKFVGPGYMQSAMTLGGGTAATSLFAGALFGYQLLWLAPVAMLLGVIMLSAISYQTLSTGERPFQAMCRHAGAPFAWGWAIGALLSSIIWHFPQYALASAVLLELKQFLWPSDWGDAELARAQWIAGIVVLVWAIGVSMLYGTSPRLIRIYERMLKYMVWGIVVCFGAVVLKTGISDWGGLVKGFCAFQIPGERNGIAGAVIVVSGLAAAVGVNMVFLYPYSLLARGWTREHRRLARFDLFTGMLVPYTLATSLMIIATANTLHDGFAGKTLSPLEAARSLSDVIGDEVGLFVFGFGVLAMALSSITLHMLTCGFVAVELFGVRVGSAGHRLATLMPAVGMLGAVYWSQMAFWVAVPTNIVCGLFIPGAYVGFILLQRNREYLGADTPRGARGALWLLGMIVSTLVLVLFLVWYVVTKGPAWVGDLVERISG